MEKIQKLVRDNIVDIIKSEGRKPHYRRLNDDEYRQELEKKLLEEVNELIAAEGKTKKTEELADVYEVLEAYLNLLEIDKGKLNKVKIMKNEANGGFRKRIYLDEVDND